MTSVRTWIAAAAGVTLAVGAAPGSAAAGTDSHGHASGSHCSSGAHTLSHYGDQVYPATGNGGYRSVHTDVHMVYDAKTNRFLSGNHVDLVDRATKCLTNFSLDFERRSADRTAGPDLTIQRVTVDGHPARFRFVQPTYPGDPHGQNDPDPRAHEAAQQNPVGGRHHNPLPPACSPELPAGDGPHALDGTQCPANKLVITPSHPIRSGQRFVVRVDYTGRPGVHQDASGATEGWFRSNSPAGDGGFVTTEPVGTEAWMPLNDHPSAKPTYDFYDTVNAGKTAICNGILVSRHHNAPDARFPGGSTTFHWHMAAPVASYLVENSVGSYDLTERNADNGVRYYTAQPTSLPAWQKRANAAIMKQQEDITEFQSQFNGTYPFTSAGVLIGLPTASFEEEMETMITFEGGEIWLDGLNHENMHQWWGDNVTESNYNMTFFKEGFATLGEYLYAARTAQQKAGGPHTAKGVAAFNASLVHQFNSNYTRGGSFWAQAPSNPTPYTLFSQSATYARPGTAYIALRQILGAMNFTRAMQQIQRTHGGGTITERQLEAAFGSWLPNRSRACKARLSTFFTQWFDTAYPTRGGTKKPTITGPGLSGPGFYTAACPAP